MPSKDRILADAFDQQAEKFERAPLQSNREVLARLVRFAALPDGNRILDAGCGPGLVAEAFLEAGHSVHGIDLSPEMVRRARERCARFGARARFEQGSVLNLQAAAPFDAAVSRLVVHHVPDPSAFVAAQVERLRPGGVLVVTDHSTDPDPRRARWHNEIERARVEEDRHQLDFDEWFDRGTPLAPKAEVRAKLLAGRARGFTPALRPDGGVTIQGAWVFLRGVKPA
jgi:SAM-dependent methyltransferase